MAGYDDYRRESPTFRKNDGARRRHAAPSPAHAQRPAARRSAARTGSSPQLNRRTVPTAGPGAHVQQPRQRPAARSGRPPRRERLGGPSRPRRVHRAPRSAIPLPLMGGALIVLVAVIGLFSLIGSVLFPASSEPTETETVTTPDPVVNEDNEVIIPFDQASFPRSTPQAQWVKGTMPYLFQKDDAWANEPYAGGTVAANACGPTCMTMVYVYLTGDRSYDPARMSAFADANNYAPTGATEWSFMTNGAAQLGLTGTALTLTRSAITSALEAGNPVILSVRPGDFTTMGHYIVLSDIDDAGMVTVHDPNNVLNCTHRWGIARLLVQASMAWAISA